MVNDAKDTAQDAKNSIIETALHAKDVAAEKVQEISHTVSCITVESST